jgi:hypothetical protein
MNSSSNDRPINLNDQSPRTNKTTTSISMLVEEDNKAHSDAAHRGPQDTLQLCATPTTIRPPTFYPSRQNTMGDDGLNEMFKEHASLDNDEEELPMSLYLPNLYYSNHSAGCDKNGRQGALRVGDDSFIPKPFTYYEL